MSLLGGHPVPSWATVIGQDAGSARVLARPPLDSGAIAPAYDLTLRYGETDIIVSETVPGSRLPTRCPDLHIMDKGVFCLGLEDNLLLSPVEAAAFWKRLGDYLVGQHYAARRRKWPAGRWLSHGPAAAKAQLEAEALAQKYGWVEDYANALENNEGWIAAAVNEAGDLSTRCPCTIPHPKRRCPKRHAVSKIVAAERQRRAGEARHFEALAQLGVKCCGRIDGCPLETKVSNVG